MQSMDSLNYNRSNTSSMATLATFSKTKACEAFSMCGGCDMVLRTADTGTISSGPVFISRDGCTVVACCHCESMSSAHRPCYMILMKPAIININQTTGLNRLKYSVNHFFKPSCWCSFMEGDV